MYSSYKYIRAFGVPPPPVFVYCNGLFVNGTETKESVVGRIAEVTMEVLSFGAWPWAICASLLKRLPCSRVIGE